ncbi:hypothetical protein LR48_Vigan01g095200 [Vigna angularis]|uniref:Uncharacterized protein n=1 Tax=Phaseolus angularis TaxID=3914 RepID=A0A0L9TLR2_PHAAN|nr:hypothetical protein LR48_Vigan01g095200 [Vigna angularis]
MANMSLIMSMSEIDDDFLNAIGKDIWRFVINISYEFIKIGTPWTSSQEEERVTNIQRLAKNLEDGETDLVAEMFSNFLLCKRKINLNFGGNKEHSRNQDEYAASFSIVCERGGDTKLKSPSLKLKQRLEKEDEGRDEHQSTEGEDADPLNVEMSIAKTPYRQKNDFERHIVKQMQTLVNHQSTYTFRLTRSRN